MSVLQAEHHREQSDNDELEVKNMKSSPDKTTVVNLNSRLLDNDYAKKTELQASPSKQNKRSKTSYQTYNKRQSESGKSRR